MTEPEDRDETNLSSEKWRALGVRADAGLHGQGAVVEAMRRVVVALEANEKASSELGGKIFWLNVLIAFLTLVACVLAAPQAWNAWKGLVR